MCVCVCVCVCVVCVVCASILPVLGVCVILALTVTMWIALRYRLIEYRTKLNSAIIQSRVKMSTDGNVNLVPENLTDASTMNCEYVPQIDLWCYTTR